MYKVGIIVRDCQKVLVQFILLVEYNTEIILLFWIPWGTQGSRPNFFWVNLGFCPNRLAPPPPPRTLGHQQLKKNFDVYFAF